MYILDYGIDCLTSNDFVALRRFAETLKCRWTLMDAKGYVLAAYRGVIG